MMVNIIQLALGIPIWWGAFEHWGWQFAGAILLGQLGMILATRRQ